MSAVAKVFIEHIIGLFSTSTAGAADTAAADTSDDTTTAAAPAAQETEDDSSQRHLNQIKVPKYEKYVEYINSYQYTPKQQGELLAFAPSKDCVCKVGASPTTHKIKDHCSCDPLFALLNLGLTK